MEGVKKVDGGLVEDGLGESYGSVQLFGIQALEFMGLEGKAEVPGGMGEELYNQNVAVPAGDGRCWVGCDRS